MANSVDPDETPRSAASHQGLHCMPSPVCPYTYGNTLNTIQYEMILQAKSEGPDKMFGCDDRRGFSP